jgi:hypothetical protein
MSQALEQAPAHIKLAVDLIQLLEENNVEPEDVLKALEIIKGDYTKKLATSPS